MKKTAFIFVALMCLLAFVSCNKSGEYRPKEKISAIWYESTTEVTMDGFTHKFERKKYQREAWEWEGKDVKSKIVYNYDGSVRSNYVYEYKDKGKRIIGITSPLPSEKKTRIRFIYNDKDMLKEIKYFTETFPENDLPYRKLEFTYDGRKISSIKETINTQRYPRAYGTVPTLLSYLLPDEMGEMLEDEAIHSKIEYDVRVQEYTFEWEKKNVSKVTIKTTVGNQSTEATLTCSYDDKRNPLLNRVASYVEEEEEELLNMLASKNNVESCTYETSGKTISVNSEYTYDRKVPVEKVSEIVEKRDGNPYRTTKERWSYEYLE